MAYEYESITNGIFSFTIPGENKTVKLFNGDKVVVKKKLNGTYLKMFKFIREIPEEINETKNTSKQKTKIEDKITSVVENETIEPSSEKIEIKAEDKIESVETEEKKQPSKRRGRRKKSE